jgi:hypothetical protein
MVEVVMTTSENVLATLDDRPLLDTARRLAAEERRATAALLSALMEIDCRRLYLGEGCASMFAYCTQVLHLAEGAAYNRIEAARAARAYPVILELFEQSAITLTAVRLLSPHLNAGNHAAVLASARHRSKREIEALVAALSPKPDAPVVVRKLPDATRAQGRSQAGTASIGQCLPCAAPVSVASVAELAPTPPAVAPVEPVRIAPLAPERYRIQLTVSRETHDRFRRAQALLRHAIPSGDAAEIFDRALTLLVEGLERKRLGETSRPRASRPSTEGSRHVAAAVRRAVWRRDGGRCAFVGASGRCRETAFLEFHHVEPYAAGGGATAENIELRCRAHNAYEALMFFGESVVREALLPWGTRQLTSSLVGYSTRVSEPARSKMSAGDGRVEQWHRN